MSDKQLGSNDIPSEEVTVDSSHLFVEVFQGLEKCRWSMTNIQMGSLTRMQVKPTLSDEEQIIVAHNLRDNMRVYSEGMLTATGAMAKLCEAMEAAGVRLDSLKTELAKASKVDGDSVTID